MARKVTAWAKEDWEKNLKIRFDRAKKHREPIEGQWRENYAVLNNAGNNMQTQFSVSFNNVLELESGEIDNSDSVIGINEIFKYIRFWHSQMSANPPSVTARPRSSEPGDRRKADAADRISRFLRKDKNAQEVSDERNLKTLTFGIGYTKPTWDEDAGDMYDFNEETSEVSMEGDHSLYSPATDDVWLDPDATRKQDIRWTIERMEKPLEEAIFIWSEHADTLKEHVMTREQGSWTSVLEDDPHEANENVEVFEYYEKGMPVNGGVGRHAFFLADGTVLEHGKNKHYKARLPIKILTYLDVPGHIYGKSVIEYCTRLQDTMQRIDSATLDAIQAHGVVRMALHESTDIEDEAISNSNWDYIKWGGSQPPNFVNPPQLMPDMFKLRETTKMAIQDMFGVNDSMMGIQKRETSAISQQTAIESGTLVHRRLFAKFAMATEEEYEDMLGICKTKWTTPRQVLVLGAEKAFEAADFSGADIAGGFDLDVEYGTSLPLDPNMAREQLMLLMPSLKEAGVSMKEILRRFKLSEVESTLDIMELAADRQREIFEEMISSVESGMAAYIEPKDLEEHQGMLEYAYQYVMTSEYKYTVEEAKQLIEQHIKQREQFAAQAAAPQAAPPGDLGVQQLPGSPGVAGAMPPSVQLPE